MAQKKRKSGVKMIPLKFKKHYPPFNAGEVAGLREDEAHEAVKLTYADYINLEDAPEVKAPVVDEDKGGGGSNEDDEKLSAEGVADLSVDSLVGELERKVDEEYVYDFDDVEAVYNAEKEKATPRSTALTEIEKVLNIRLTEDD